MGPHPGDTPVPAAGGTSGRRVVAAMFAFGLLVITGFWTYWALYDRPLRPLRERIAAEHPEAFVQIAAGRAKKSQVEELRVVMQTPFDPLADADRAASVAGSVRDAVADWERAGEYEQLEVVLYQSLAERRDDYWSERTAIATLADEQGREGIEERGRRATPSRR